MFPVEFLVTRLSNACPKHTIWTEDFVNEFFIDDLARFGKVKFHGSCVMSCGPFGASMFYRFRVEPENACNLALLLEFAQIPREDMLTGVLRENRYKIASPSERLGTYLSLSSEGGFLDELPPPETVSLKNLGIDLFELQSDLVAEWKSAREYIDQLETEVATLKARLVTLDK